MKLNPRKLNLIKLDIASLTKDTFISLAFLLLPKKNNLFSKLQLFPQNTDALHFPEHFCIFQRTIYKQ